MPFIDPVEKLLKPHEIFPGRRGHNFQQRSISPPRPRFQSAFCGKMQDAPMAIHAKCTKPNPYQNFKPLIHKDFFISQ
jgi:hypothetical protein